MCFAVNFYARSVCESSSKQVYVVPRARSIQRESFFHIVILHVRVKIQATCRAFRDLISARGFILP